jgi:hypothetical protein
MRRHLVPEPHVREWRKTGIGHKEYTVCTKCNNTWMADVENNHAKPCISDMVLSKAAITLDISCLVSISIFIFLKSVVSDHVQSKEPFFSMRVRRAFRQSLALPPTQVWLGCIDIFEPEYAVSRMKYSYSVATISPGHHFYTYTWSVGHLLIQMVASRSKSTRFRMFPVFIDQGPDWARYALPIWPPPALSIVWPPPQHFSHSLVDEFTNRFAP